MKERGANDSQDDQQVSNHREEDDQCQRKNEQGLCIQAGAVSAHPETKLSGKKRNGHRIGQSQSAGLMSSKKQVPGDFTLKNNEGTFPLVRRRYQRLTHFESS